MVADGRMLSMYRLDKDGDMAHAALFSVAAEKHPHVLGVAGDEVYYYFRFKRHVRVCKAAPGKGARELFEGDCDPVCIGSECNFCVLQRAFPRGTHYNFLVGGEWKRVFRDEDPRETHWDWLMSDGEHLVVGDEGGSYDNHGEMKIGPIEVGWRSQSRALCAIR